MGRPYPMRPGVSGIYTAWATFLYRAFSEVQRCKLAALGDVEVRRRDRCLRLLLQGGLMEDLVRYKAGRGNLNDRLIQIPPVHCGQDDIYAIGGVA
jgi:hypothetical protein